MRGLSEISYALSAAAVLVSRGDTEEAETQAETHGDRLGQRTCNFVGAPSAHPQKPKNDAPRLEAATLCVSPLPPYLRAKQSALQPNGRSRKDAGFTLVELLVSLVLLGMLSLVLFDGLHFGRSVWQATESKTAAVDRIRAFEASFSTELARAYPEIEQTEAGEAAKVKFDGEKDRVTFLTPSVENPGLLIETTLRPELVGDKVHLIEARRLELARVGGESRMDTRLPSVTAVHLSYFGSEKDNEAPDWHDSWSNQPKFPDLVRVQVSFADRRFSWPDLIVKPRVEADVTCTFDPLARACSGR